VRGPSKADSRAAARRRTRLRSGKVLDSANRFLIECAVHDRSEQGARLRLAEVVALPESLRLFDDERQQVREMTLVWRRGHDIGVRWVGAAEIPLAPSELMALRGKYYAVPG
jgi:hypothetical protein